MERQIEREIVDDTLLIVNLSDCELLEHFNIVNKGMSRITDQRAGPLIAKSYLEEHRRWHRNFDQSYFDRYGRLAKCEPLTSITSLTSQTNPI